MLGLTVVACGSGDGGGTASDEAAIEELIREVLSATVDGDAAKLAGLMSEACGDIEKEITTVLEQIERSGIEVQYNLTGADVRNLDGGSAEAAPQGSIITSDGEEPLGDESDYVRMVKEGSGWKVADCDFFAR